MGTYWVQYVFVGEIEAQNKEEVREKIAKQTKDSPLTACAADNGLRLYKSILTEDDPIKQERVIEDVKTRLAMESCRFA